MLFRNLWAFKNIFLKAPIWSACRVYAVPKCFYSQELESKYSEEETEKILSVLNEPTLEDFTKYDIAKTRLRKFADWKKNHGQVKTLSDIIRIEGFSDKITIKLYNSILSGGNEANGKIRGQILHPNLSEAIRQKCKTVLAVYITANSVSWTLIDRPGYEVVRWQYHGINYKDEKKSQITEIMDIGWRISQQLPEAEICVMKAEATTLRAAGSDPKNPKVLSVNLQKAQMVSIIVALINARGYLNMNSDSEASQEFKQKVYFLKPSLPFRLYGTLVGNEQISTEQVIEMILQETNLDKSKDGGHVFIPEDLKTMFRTRRDLEKDMLGHCLLMALTFMDLCIYKNKERLNKLLNSD